MIETKGYSIWLEPEGENRDRLAEIIRDLSAQYNTPVFDPHVTLLGGILLDGEEVANFVGEIARRFVPYTIHVTGDVDCEDYWTKALFVKVDETEAVLGANRLAREVCGIQTGEYHPHLSLMYSEDIPIDERLRIARSLDVAALTCSFNVDKLHLHKTDGGVEDWEKIGEFELTGH